MGEVCMNLLCLMWFLAGTYSCSLSAQLQKKRSRLFSLNGNNAVLEFFLEGVPDVVERHLDSKKVRVGYDRARHISLLCYSELTYTESVFKSVT